MIGADKRACDMRDDEADPADPDDADRRLFF